MKHSKLQFFSRLSALSITLMLGMTMAAQTVTVQGTVTDEKGESVIGATVKEKGGQGGTVTDIDGRYTLTVSPQSTLVITCIGFEAVESAVNGRTQIDVIMGEGTETMNELVVVGYGTMRKSDLTGAVGSLSSKNIEGTPVANIGQALQGKISGLQVVDAGKPGDNVNIKIRGLGSINNCDPLVVIDGVPTDLGINAINMMDVDRVDVLKDASATAIYGSRGANGVVMKPPTGLSNKPQNCLRCLMPRNMLP